MTSMTSCASGVLCIAIPIRQSRVPLSCLAGASVHFDGVSSPQPFFSWACSICSLLYIMYHLLPFNEVVKSIYVNKFYMSKLGLNMNRWNRIPSLFTVECGVRRCQIGSTAQQKWHIKIPSFTFFFHYFGFPLQIPLHFRLFQRLRTHYVSFSFSQFNSSLNCKALTK